MSLRTELLRKTVHIAFGGLALSLRYLTPVQAGLVAAAALGFNLFVLHRLTGGALLRDHERARGFSAGIAWYPAAVLVTIVVFHARLELAAAVWGLLAFGDGMATVSGVLVRGPRLPWNRDKSWSGLLAFTLYGAAAAAFLIRWTQRAALDGGPGGAAVGMSFLGAGSGLPVSETTLLIVACLVVAALTGLVESLDTAIDDNLLVPLAGGSLLYAATFVGPLLSKTGG